MTDKTYKSCGYTIASLLILLLLLPALAGCEKEKEKATIQPGSSSEPPVVQVATSIKKDVLIYGEYVASVDPTTGAEIADVKARVDAVLLKQHFTEGEPVSKGQLLFTLDPSTYQAELNGYIASLNKGKADLLQATDSVSVAQSKANLEAYKAQLYLAEITEKRLKPLAQNKAVPQQDYDNALANLRVARANVMVGEANLKNTILTQKVNIEQAKAEIESAQASITKAKIELSYCSITSPIEGIAGKRLVSPGNLVGHGEATLLVTITDLDPLRVNFNISETDYIKIMKNAIETKGKKAKSSPLELILADGSIYHYKGEIALAQPTLDPKTGTLNVVGEFPNPNRLLRPGMFGRIRLITELKKGCTVMPQKAILVMQSSKIVYVVDENNKVVLRSISQGAQTGDDVVVLSGVKPGERVIIEGQLKVRPSMVVKPVVETVKPKSDTVKPHHDAPEKGE